MNASEHNFDQPAPRSEAQQKIVLLLFVLLILTALFLVFKGMSVSPLQVQFCWAGLSSLIVLLLYAGSTAVAEGKILGINFNVTGQLASFVILYVLLAVFSPNISSQTIRIYIKHEDKVLNQRFTAIVHVPNMEPISKTGENGSLSVQIPSLVEELVDVIIECSGFSTAKSGPYKIISGVVNIPLLRSKRPPPVSAISFPSEKAITDMPSKSLVLRSPKTTPSKVTFRYKNLASHDLRLVFLSCSRYYKTVSTETFPVNSYWLDWDFPARDDFIIFDSFAEDSSGWFCFFVARVDSASGIREYFYLGSKNLFNSPLATLIVKESMNPDAPYHFGFTAEQ